MTLSTNQSSTYDSPIILPTKHISIRNSLLGVGAKILEHLYYPEQSHHFGVLYLPCQKSPLLNALF
jgi:hypothetical protein